MIAEELDAAEKLVIHEERCAAMIADMIAEERCAVAEAALRMEVQCATTIAEELAVGDEARRMTEYDTSLIHI